MKRKKLTREGYNKLKKELNYLIKVKRKEVADELKDAASYGDLSENFSYESAKEEQSNVETRISELKETLKRAEIVGEGIMKEGVQVGSVIEVEVEGKKKELSIVGETESDPFKGKISCDSPIGKSLIGKKVGDTCLIKTPGGLKEYKITKIA